MADNTSNGLTPQQVSDAQHLDNMTSLQQPSAAEQSPITQNGEVKGDAPISSPPTPSPDNPSLFNEPKNPNNKVVEVESQKTSEDLDKGDISDTSSDQGSKFTEDLKGLSGDAINLTITAQTNEQGVPGDKQPELDPGVNKAGGNTGNQGPTGGGGIPRAGQAPTGTPASSTSPTSQPNNPTQTVEPQSSVESAPSPTSPPAPNPVTPQPLFTPEFVPEQPQVSAPSILAPDSQTIAEDSTAVGNVLTNDSDVGSLLSVISFSVNGVTYAPGQIALITGIGTVTIAADGSYLFTPEPSWNGVVPTIDYTTNTEKQSTLNIAVTPIDDPVVVVDLSATPNVNEGVTNGITYTATLTGGVAKNDIIVTLANGESITIPAGQTSGGISINSPSDDVYTDPLTIGNAIASAIEQGPASKLEALIIATDSSVNTLVADTTDAVTVTLSSTTNGNAVTEGGSIVYTVTTSAEVQGSPLVVKLSNGTEITIPVGSRSASSDPVAVRTDEGYVQGTQTLTAVTIESALQTANTANNFEAITTTGTVNNTVVDDTDAVTVTLSSTTNGNAVTEGGSIVYTVTTSAEVQGSPLVVKLSNGTEITIPVGSRSASSDPVAVRTDEGYVQGTQTLTAVTIESALQTANTANNFEAITTTGTVNNTVVDDTDAVTVTLSSTTNGNAVTEGGSIVYTVTTSAEVQGSPLVVKLSNGTEITIPVGSRSASSDPVAVRTDEGYVQGTQTLTAVTIESALQTANTANNFEAITTTGTVNNTVVDDTDAVTVTLSSTTNGNAVTEGGSIVYTVTTSAEVQGSPLVVKLSNGTEITIPVGSRSASSDPVAVRTDEGYVQGTQTLTAVTIESALQTANTANNFEAITTTGTVNNTVVDDTDAVTVTLSSTTNGNAVTEGGSIVYTVTTSAEVQGSPLVVKLSNGTEITIPVGSRSASSDPVAVRTDEGYVQGTQTLTAVTIESALQTANTANNFEAITTTGTVNNTVVDDTDAVTVTLSSTTNGNAVTEGGSIVYTVTTSAEVQGSPLVVKLSNGTEITIPVGSRSASSDPVAVRTDEGYVQGTQTLTAVTIESALQTANTANNFEAITTTGTVNNTVVDDTDAVTVTLSSTTNGNAVTEGGSIVYTVTTSAEVQGSPLVVKLSNGTEITIPVGSRSASSDPVAVRTDEGYVQGTQTLTAVTIESALQTANTANNFEAITTTGTVNNTVVDDTDAVTVTLSSTTNGNAVTEGGSIVYTVTTSAEVQGSPLVVKLSNGTEITIPVGSRSASSDPVAVRTDEGYVQGTQTLTAVTIESALQTANTANNFEAITTTGTVNNTVVDDTDAVTVTLSSTTNGNAVTEGGSIVYTVTTSAEVQGSPLVVKLSNGTEITIPVGSRSASSDPVAVRTDEGYVQGTQTLTAVTIESALQTANTANNFEAITTTGTVNNTVVDDTDAVTVTLSSTTNGNAVTEGGSIVYTVTTSAEVQGSPLVVKLSNGTEITIPVGSRSASSDPVAVRTDEGYVQGTQTLTAVTIESALQTANTANNFEAITTTGTVNNTVVDDTDAVTVTLSSTTNGNAVTEGGSIVYTVTTSAEVQGSPLVVKLSNGTEITIPVGSRSASSDPVAVRTDEGYVQGTQTLTAVTIESALQTANTANNFEAITTTGTVNNTVVDDTDAVTVTLSSTTNGNAVTEGGSIVYTVTTSAEVQGSPLVVKLSNGTEITIPVGSRSASSDPVAVRTDEGYVQGTQTLTAVTIESALQTANTANNFEAITTTGTVNNTVVDDTDAVTVTLSSTTNGNAVTEGGSIVYTVTTSAEVQGSPLVVKLSNGTEITIPVGSRSASSDPVAVRTDEGYVQGTQTLTAVTIESALQTANTANNFEAITTTGTVNNTVVDDTDATAITLFDPEPVRDGTNNVTIVAEVDNAVTDSPLVILLSNGATITIPVGERIGVSTPFVEGVDVAIGSTQGSQEISIASVSGGNYEALNTADKATIVVQTPELTLYKSALVTDLGSELGGTVGSDLGADRSGNFSTGFSGKVDSAGDVISYTLTVKNTGQTPLSQVIIYDQLFKDLISVNLFDDSADGTPTPLTVQSVLTAGVTNYFVALPTSLPAGVDYLIKYDYVVTLDDVNRGYIENTAVIDSDLTDPLAITAQTQDYGITDGVAYTQVGVANLYDVAINKYANVNSVSGVGSVIEYQIYVNNEGTGALSGVKVEDQMFSTASDQDGGAGTQIAAELHTLRPDGGYDVTNVFYTIGSDGLLNVGTLLYGQYAVITYDHIVSADDYTIFQEGIQKSIFDYASIGDKLDQVEFSYGTFDAYVNKVDADPYSTVVGEQAKLFFNVDNTGVAVGVNAGVMAGDRNGNSDHLRAVFNPNLNNGGKSVIEGVSIAFTNAKDVELAFKVTYGDSNSSDPKTFNGSIVIGNNGSVTLREIDGAGPSSYQLNGFSSKSGSTYSFVGTDIPNGWFTVTEASGPGGAQNKIYTLNFVPGTNFVNSFDFSVVGDAIDNSADQIKVVDVKFDTINFTASNINNTATVFSKEDNVTDQSDEISTNSILVTSTVGSGLTGIIDTDIEAPTITSAQNFSYSENQGSTSAVIATVTASDDVKVSAFRFADSKSSISADGFYQINNSGEITLTTAGLSSSANDFEVSSSLHTLSIQAKDAAGNWSNSQNVAITEVNANEAPVATNDTLAATKGTAVTYTATQLTGNDADVDGNLLTIASVTNGSNGTVVLNDNGTVTFTPTANFIGVANFSYTVSDGAVRSSAATVTVNVSAPDDPGVSTITRSGNILTANIADLDGVRSASYQWYYDGGLTTVTTNTYTLDNAQQNNTKLIYVVVSYTDSFGAKTTQSPTYLINRTSATLTKQPITLDLNGDGVQYLSMDAGVTYDYNHDGIAESTAWVAPEDGLLAMQKEDGTHNIVFSTQAGETDLQGLAKVYDTNHDKILDAQDAGFNQFGVWQDADSDGVVDAGEFLSLADRGIISLSLTSDGVIHTAADGDVTIYGQTTYTMTDGSTGIAEDVAFAVSSVGTDGNGVQDIYQIASVTDAPIVVDHFSADDRDRIDLSSILNPTNSVQSTISIDADGSTSTHSTIAVNIGGVDYEVATLYGKDIGVEEALGTHPGGASLTDSLNGASWTDVVDVSSDHGGPASIFADGGSLTNSFSNEAGDWTVQIKSGTATVDALNKQITFSSDNAENLAIITTADGTSHEITNVDKILWH